MLQKGQANAACHKNKNYIIYRAFESK